MALVMLVFCTVIRAGEVRVAFGTFEMLIADMFEVESPSIVTQHTQSTCVHMTFTLCSYMLSE
jgi:hypothetical protein